MAKFVMILLIIIIHSVDFPLKEQFLPITRCAVPCFFMVTGYFLYGRDIESTLNHSITKIFQLTIKAYLLYFVFGFFMNTLFYKNSVEYSFTHALTDGEYLYGLDNAIIFFFFNNTRIIPHLWYLNALLYALMLLRLVSKYIENRITIFITIFLMTACGILAYFFVGEEYVYYRNWLLEAFPLIMIGFYIHKFEKIEIPRYALFPFLAVFILLIYIEYYLWDFRGDVSLSILATSVLIFYEVTRFRNYECNNWIMRTISKVSRDGGLIYILQYIVIVLLAIIMSKVPETMWSQSIYHYLNPIIILIITYIGARLSQALRLL